MILLLVWALMEHVNKTVADVPAGVCVAFDEYTRPTSYSLQSTNSSELHHWGWKTRNGAKSHFPLLWAWAGAGPVQESQGLLLSKVVTDIGQCDPAARCTIHMEPFPGPKDVMGLHWTLDSDIKQYKLERR